MNEIKILIIFTILIGTLQVSYAQENESSRELKISDDEKIILFAGFSIAVIAIFLFLARDIILRKKTTYDKQEHESKKDKALSKSPFSKKDFPFNTKSSISVIIIDNFHIY